MEEPPQAAGYTCQVSVQTGLQEGFPRPVCVLHLEVVTKSHSFPKVFSVYGVQSDTRLRGVCASHVSTDTRLWMCKGEHRDLNF